MILLQTMQINCIIKLLKTYNNMSLKIFFFVNGAIQKELYFCDVNKKLSVDVFCNHYH